jgi:5-hydroxyisourate hydrolase-like protein (transthyretin family)
VTIPLRAQSPAKTTTAKVARGTVSGRVTIKNKPAPGVVVGLRKLITTVTIEPFLKATTDQEGVYHITNVAAGSYEILPAAPAYVVAEASTSRGKTVIVGDDEDVEDINFSLVRGGVITGKVTDADGRPLIQQQVNLYRAGDFNNPSFRQVFPTGNTQTDDRGIYRFFGLAAGRYKIASGRGDETFGTTFSPTRNVYKQVYHPDVTEEAKATIIEVGEGSESTNVDIALGRAVQTFAVSGRVIDGATGTPAPNIRFGLQRNSGQRLEIVEGFGQSNRLGDFVIDGLTPGRYGVFLYPSQSPELRVDGIAFDVVDQDVNGITIRLTKGASVSGVIVFEHEDKKAFAKLLEMKLGGYVSSQSGIAVAAQSTASSIAPDGGFRLVGLPPGILNLSLNAPMAIGPPKGFLISRVENNGVVLPMGLEINEGDELTGVRVYVSFGTASIRGTVNFDRGLAPEGARMFARVAKVGPPMTMLSSALVDARGHFLLEGIPAGVYEVSVSLFVQGARTPPQSAKKQVIVQDGVVSDVSLTLELARPKP